MANPTLRDVHVDTALENLSLGYFQDDADFVFDKVFPLVPVAHLSNKFRNWGKAWMARAEAKIRGADDPPHFVDQNVTNDTYSCDNYNAAARLHDEIARNADNAEELRQVLTQGAVESLKLQLETLWATAFFATGIWSADVTPGTLWDASGSTPFSDIFSRKDSIRRTGMRQPNVMIFGARAWSEGIINNADIVDRIKYTQPAVPTRITEALVAQALGLRYVGVARASKNTAVEGATAVYANVLGDNDALLLYAPERPSILTPSAGYTFVHTDSTVAGGARGTGPAVTTYRDDKHRAEVIDVNINIDFKVTDSGLGVFFSNVVT